MRGPFGLVIAAGLAILIVAILFSLAPIVGGSIDNGNPNLGRTESLTLLNATGVSTGYKYIGNVQVTNASGNVLVDPTDYTYVSSSGEIKLVPYAPNYNGTYSIVFDTSHWVASVNTDITEGGTWFSQNTTWVTLLFLGIIAGIVIAMFMRW